MTETWGLMTKSQTDNEKIEQAIDRITEQHNENPDAHLADGQSLKSHRASEIIDHIAQSIVNDKIITIARAYTAILKVPTLQTETLFFAGIDNMSPVATVVSSTKTAIEILSRTDSGDDSEYIHFINSSTAYMEMYMTAPVLPLGQKIYSMKFKWRAKLLNATVGSASHDFFFDDGSSVSRTLTTAWQDFEYEIFFLMDSGDNYKIICQQTLDSFFQGLMYTSPTGANSQNQIAISKFYMEAKTPIDMDKEDFFDFKDACDYVTSLGGGSVFIKNGTYNTGLTNTALGSYVEIIGESLAGVILNASEPNYNLLIGCDLPEEYNAGTITLTQNSASVVSSGVTWTSARTVGKYLLNKVTGHYYKIVSWQDATHITIDTLYQGATTGGLGYLIVAMNTENRLSNFTHNFELILKNAINVTIENVKNSKGYFYCHFLENLQVNDCDFEEVQGQNQYDYVTNSKWVNNTFKNYINYCLYLLNNSCGNIVESNMFVDNKRQCIVTRSFNGVINGNVLLNNGWTGGELNSAILLYTDAVKNIVTNNIVRNCNSYGIGSQSNCNYNIVTNNICINNYSAGVVNNGANSITANNVV